MENIKNTFTDIGLFLFRISIGSFMLFGHGLGKLMRIIEDGNIKFIDPFGLGEKASFYLATFTEFFASVLIILGVLNRISTLSLIITMAVAAFIAHWGDPFSKQEKALLFLSSYILLFLLGPGKYSLQNLINKNFKISNRFIRFILN